MHLSGRSGARRAGCQQGATSTHPARLPQRHPGRGRRPPSSRARALYPLARSAAERDSLHGWRSNADPVPSARLHNIPVQVPRISCGHAHVPRTLSC